MPTNGIRIRYETLRSLGFASISGTYAAVGTAFANPVRILKITNTTDAALIISFDGVNNMDIVAAKSAWIHDYCSNKSINGGELDQSVGDRVWVKQVTAPTVGTVYVTVIYASQS